METLTYTNWKKKLNACYVLLSWRAWEIQQQSQAGAFGSCIICLRYNALQLLKLLVSVAQLRIINNLHVYSYMGVLTLIHVAIYSNPSCSLCHMRSVSSSGISEESAVESDFTTSPSIYEQCFLFHRWQDLYHQIQARSLLIAMISWRPLQTNLESFHQSSCRFQCDCKGKLIAFS